MPASSSEYTHSSQEFINHKILPNIFPSSGSIEWDKCSEASQDTKNPTTENLVTETSNNKTNKYKAINSFFQSAQLQNSVGTNSVLIKLKEQLEGLKM